MVVTTSRGVVWWVGVALLASCGVVLAAGAQTPAPSRVDADRAAEKLNAVMSRSLLTPVDAPIQRTTFSDREVNAYMAHQGQADLPVGVTSAAVVFGDDGRVETRAIVNLDLLRAAQPRGALDPLAYVSGQLEVLVVARFSASRGKGVLSYESGAVKGIPLPRSIVSELVTFYTRTPDLPEGIVLNQPFELPARIREVAVQRGSATVVQ
jgi:hypothetical protein